MAGKQLEKRGFWGKGSGSAGASPYRGVYGKGETPGEPGVSKS
jgi:hypothetical protein